ncbi:hypothetical protein FISHEDRAFT_77260 [Fistulina hepatica ATCC 64428]|uniref:Uncharacterized protein n=1 Tax=Fistulina hepatica ATCC 64428 TaxID=1128425 RepID=A0A0D7A405_9AGAR|nr:hypothetical protein FISHEDRAFT_77260 [Fistulina hepatica ATCC 64428]
MPSLSEIKEKALKAKDAGVHKFQDARGRNTSVPTARTNWDMHGRTPARMAPTNSRSSDTSLEKPPLPRRTSSGTSAGSAGTAPPPINRNTRPDAPRPASTSIDWVNLSEEDKQIFFSWLDEFFSRHLGKDVSPRS